MEWIQLNELSQLDSIKTDSNYSLIFKHSTRCSISSWVKRRFESEWDEIPKDTKLYFLDLINYRNRSSAVAEQFHVHHESPQILLIHNGTCILDASHSDISAEEVASQISK